MAGLLILFLVAAGLIVLLGTVAMLRGLTRPRRKTYGRALARGVPVEPGDVGLHGREVTFSLADGSSSPGWILEGGDPTGPTVLVLHGHGDSRYGALTWTPLLAPLASRLVLFDARGHGEAQATTSTLSEREPDDVLAVIEQIEPPPESLVLFGYSMGAGIALATAARPPRNPRTPPNDRATPPIVGVIADGPYRFWHEPVHGVFREHRWPRWPFTNLVGLVLRMQHRRLPGMDRAADAAALPCPLLVLHGERDPVCPIDSARAIAQAAPRGELVEFEQGGHLDLASRDETPYRAALQIFFARLTPQPPARAAHGTGQPDRPHQPEA